MINTKELRIGNIVQDENGNEIIITSIEDGVVTAKSDYIKYYWAKDIFGAPITDLLLVRLKRVDYKECRIIARDISYIHQLQNLYFSLTSEELMIAK